MRIMNVLHDSVADGEGLRTVVFFAGCGHGCIGCHNELSQDFFAGTTWTVDEVLSDVLSNPLTNVTLSGGDPFFQSKEASELARKCKEHGKTVWTYTGFTYEEIALSNNPNMRELLRYTAVLVDGRFEQSKRDLTLLYRGSSNQRIYRLYDGNIVGEYREATNDIT